MLGIEAGEELREAFAQPLLVIVLPADRLSPPLMRKLVGEEEFREPLEVRRIRSPDEWRVRQRLVERDEVARAVPARQRVLDERQRERLVRCVANDRAIELHDVHGRLGEISRPAEFPLIRQNRQVERVVHGA